MGGTPASVTYAWWHQLLGPNGTIFLGLRAENLPSTMVKVLCLLLNQDNSPRKQVFPAPPQLLQIIKLRGDVTCSGLHSPVGHRWNSNAGLLSNSPLSHYSYWLLVLGGRLQNPSGEWSQPKEVHQNPPLKASAPLAPSLGTEEGVFMCQKRA